MPIRLPNHVLVRTRHSEDLRETYARVYAEPQLELDDGDGLHAASQCRIGGVRLGYAKFGVRSHWQFPNADCFLFLLPIGGTGVVHTRNRDCAIGNGRAAAISPAAGYAAHYDAGFETFSLKLDEPMLTRALEGMIGRPADAPLVFDPQGSGVSEAGAALLDYVPRLAATVERAGPDLPDWWIAQTEQTIAMLVLLGHRHSFSHRLGVAADPSQPALKRAEAYIEAHCDRAITLEDLAQASGVSVFSLFRAFKTVHGCSPLAYAAQLRRRHLFG